jgi:hypothetical protein
VRRGLIKEAIQLIERAPLPELTAKRIEHLIALHPQAPVWARCYGESGMVTYC